MLQTNLKHVVSAEHYNEVLSSNENVMICCGRMGPMCIPVYASMKELEQEYPNIEFYDMDFDHPEAAVIRNLAECRGFMGLPFTVYYKNGKVVHASSSIQSKDEIETILGENFSAENAHNLSVS